MKPVKQQYLHKPEEGIFGDCHRAAVASILEMELAKVPHFSGIEPQDAWQLREKHWLREHGLIPIYMPFHENDQLQNVLDATKEYLPGVCAILGGTSRNGTGHSVVVCDGEIVHDPSIDESGIIGPMSDGHYWIEFFVSAVCLRDRPKGSRLQESKEG